MATALLGVSSRCLRGPAARVPACILGHLRGKGPRPGRIPCHATAAVRCLNSATRTEGDGSKGDHRNDQWKSLTIGAALLGSIGVVLGVKRYSHCNPAAVEGSPSNVNDLNPVERFHQVPVVEPPDALDKYGVRIPDLPNFRRSEVEEHNNMEKGIWVTYKYGVYDVSEFVYKHPGGRKVLLAAGRQLEPFFALYGFHKSEMVMDIMEEYRIGNLHEEDAAAEAELALKGGLDPFSGEPVRHPTFKINSKKPFNAEPPQELLTQEYITPNDIFFVRNHLPVPMVDMNNYHLEVGGVGVNRPLNITMEELRKWFKPHTIVATVQCAGNRRSDMNKRKAVKGLAWGAAAISTAEWTGVKLADVLSVCGASEDKVGHVIFQGFDIDDEGIPYEASIPAATAFDERHDVLLAFQMNGEDLPVDHGYPLRVIVPGVAGARQVKWLHKIILSEAESEGHFQKRDYRSFNPSIDWSNVDFSKSVAIQEGPIQSAICHPEDGAIIEDDVITVKGYAWSGGGSGVIRVDVSFDGGKTWVDAELQNCQQRVHRQWAWTIFEVDFEIPSSHEGPIDIVCKAVDTSHNTQPETSDGIWNIRGLVNNAWHRITVNVKRD